MFFQNHLWHQNQESLFKYDLKIFLLDFLRKNLDNLSFFDLKNNLAFNNKMNFSINNINSCLIHISLKYTHFCLDSHCMQPLCSECLKDHLKFHNENKLENRFENISNVKMSCMQKINKTYEILSKKMERFLSNNTLFSFQAIFDEGLQKIERNKETVLNCINHFFEDFKEKYKASMSHLMDFEIESTNTFEKIQSFINKLQYYQVNIESKNPHQILKKICLLDAKSIIKKCDEDLESLRKFGNEGNVVIQMNEELLTELNLSLQKHLSVIKEKVCSNEIKIEQKDFFDEDCDNKFLPYFLPNSKSLYLLNLENSFENISFKPIFQHIQLNMDYNIPNYSESLITQNGDIYMITDFEIFKYDYKLKKLIQKNKLIVPRNRYAICSDFGYIYILGGILTNHKKEYCDKCEKYDIETEKMKTISKMPFPNYSSTIFLLKNKCIYLFGGLNKDDLQFSNKVFRYDIEKDYWKEIDPILNFHDNFKNFSLNFHQKALQINKNNVLIFGSCYDSGLKELGWQIDWNIVFSINKKVMTIFKEKNQFEKMTDFKFYGNPVIFKNNVVILGKCFQSPKKENEKHVPQVYLFNPFINQWLMF